MDEEKVYLTKEQALEIAKFNGKNIHCFLSASFGLIGWLSCLRQEASFTFL